MVYCCLQHHCFICIFLQRADVPVSCTVSLCVVYDKSRSEITTWADPSVAFQSGKGWKGGGLSDGAGVLATQGVVGRAAALRSGEVSNSTETALQSRRKSRQTCKQQVLRAQNKKSKSGTICLPVLYKLCSDNSKKWVLAFFSG